MSISKIFIPNFACVLTNERYKLYQMGFSFCRLGHAPGVGLWGTGGKVKRSNIINMSISKIFIPNSLCVFSQIKDRKHIEQNFHSVARVMPRGGTCGCWGSQKL